MLTLRTRIFIVISLVVLFILGVSLILIISSKKPAAAPAGQPTTTAGAIIDQTNFNAGVLTPPPAAVTAGLTVKQPTTEEAIKNAAKQTAKIFVERYGSYSSDNNYQNIREVESLVTDNLWTKISGKLKGSAPAAGAFSGVTTLVLSGEFNSWDASSAELILKVQRQENKAGAVVNTYQDITVSLVRQGDNWLVSSFKWK